jgi:hypothetical protein
MTRKKGVPLRLALLPFFALASCKDSALATPEKSGANATRNVAEQMAVDGAVTLRIRADSANPRRFWFGNLSDPSGFADVSTRLSNARRETTDATTLYLFTYEGAAGFDVIRVLNRAKDLGFARVEAVADYSDDASLVARRKWKRWTEDLHARPSPSGENDAPSPDAGTQMPRRGGAAAAVIPR